MQYVQDNMPAEVLPKIFIGSIHAAFNQEALLEKGITHVSALIAKVTAFCSLFDIILSDSERISTSSYLPQTIQLFNHRHP